MSNRRGGGSWWKGTKPTDILSVLVSLLSVAIAVGALYKANQVSEQQAEAAAPVLAPGTVLAERGDRIRVVTEYAAVTKRADRLFLDRRAGRFVIPLRNGGSGIALTVGLPVLVADCNQEPSMLPTQAILPPLGTYVIPSGGSDQVGYLEPKGDPSGYVPKHKQSWYSFDYRHFGSIGPAGPKPADLLIWYTDGAQRKLRWTCVSYLAAGHNAREETEWGVLAQEFGTRPMVSMQPNTR